MKHALHHPTKFAVLSGLLGLAFLAAPAAAQTRTQVATNADVARRDMVGAITGQAFAVEPGAGYAPSSPADPDLGEQRLLIPDQRTSPSASSPMSPSSTPPTQP